MCFSLLPVYYFLHYSVNIVYFIFHAKKPPISFPANLRLSIVSCCQILHPDSFFQHSALYMNGYRWEMYLYHNSLLPSFRFFLPHRNINKLSQNLRTLTQHHTHRFHHLSLPHYQLLFLPFIIPGLPKLPT